MDRRVPTALMAVKALAESKERPELKVRQVLLALLALKDRKALQGPLALQEPPDQRVKPAAPGLQARRAQRA